MPVPIIICSGPTATGKTKLSLYLAKKIQEEGEKVCIINFDSLCFYKELKIGTAKPSLEERSLCPHLLFDICSYRTPLNISEYRGLAAPALKDCLERGITPILVGGSGFYLRALLKGTADKTEMKSPLIEKKVQQLYQQEGIEAVQSKLTKLDPESCQALHPNDHYRLTRALEYVLTTGRKISEAKASVSDPYDLKDGPFKEYSFLHFSVDLPKEAHWKVIQERTSQMLCSGLLSEVQEILSLGALGDERPLNSIGYKEGLDYLLKKGSFKNQQEMSERISISTRQLAKSQRTFFKKIPDRIPLDIRDGLEQAWQKTLAAILQTKNPLQ